MKQPPIPDRCNILFYSYENHKIYTDFVLRTGILVFDAVSWGVSTDVSKNLTPSRQGHKGLGILLDP